MQVVVVPATTDVVVLALVEDAVVQPVQLLNRYPAEGVATRLTVRPPSIVHEEPAAQLLGDAAVDATVALAPPVPLLVATVPRCTKLATQFWLLVIAAATPLVRLQEPPPPAVKLVKR